MNLSVQIRKKMPSFDMNIDLVFKKNTLTAIIGPSGSGKTTLVRIIAGLEKADSGLIQFGQEVWLDTKEKITLPTRKRRLGYVFQEYTLFPHLTVEANIGFAAVNRNKVRQLLDIFGLTALKNRRPEAISGGERQRCAICQALAREPQVLLMDEPFSALDVFTRRDLREKLRIMKEELSMPILYVTHDVNEALYLADQVIPTVNGAVDHSWLQRSITRIETRSEINRAGSRREPRLSIAY